MHKTAPNVPPGNSTTISSRPTALHALQGDTAQTLRPPFVKHVSWVNFRLAPIKLHANPVTRASIPQKLNHKAAWAALLVGFLMPQVLRTVCCVNPGNTTTRQVNKTALSALSGNFKTPMDSPNARFATEGSMPIQHKILSAHHAIQEHSLRLPEQKCALLVLRVVSLSLAGSRCANSVKEDTSPTRPEVSPVCHVHLVVLRIRRGRFSAMSAR